MADGIRALNPLAYWQFSELSGVSAANAMTGGLAAALINGAAFSPNGAQGRGVVLNGVNNFVQVAHNAAYVAAQGGLSLWFKPDAFGSVQGLASKNSVGLDAGGGFTILLNADGTVSFSLESKTATFTTTSAATSPLDTTVTANAAAWNNVTITWGAGGMQLWLNGVLVDTNAYSGGLTGADDPLIFGANTQNATDTKTTGASNFFKGAMDEAAFFARQPTTAEVQALYQNGSMGSNTDPAGVNDSGSISENSVSTLSGNVLTNDTDGQGDTLSVFAVKGATGGVGVSQTGTYGSVTINADGTYDYVLNQASTALNALAQGATATETFAYTVSDGHGGLATANLVITINGENDGPVVTGEARAINEDVATALTGNVLTNDKDPENGVLNVVSMNGGGVGVVLNTTYGTISISATGAYSYKLNNALPAVQALKAGEVVHDQITYTVKDPLNAQATATLDITITGTNDAPKAVADTGAINAALATSITGSVLTNDSDVDHDAVIAVNQVKGSAVNVGANVAGTYGTLNLQADGTYTYTLNPASAALIALKAGQTATDTFSYRVGDGAANSGIVNLVVTITGKNEGPTANVDLKTVAEDTVAAQTGNVLTNDTDPDKDILTVVSVNGAPGNVGVAIVTTYGTMTIGANGAYSYTLNNASSAVQSLGAGDNATDTFSYSISDGQGGTAAANVVVTITGRNDGPVATIDTDTANAGDVIAAGNVLANDTDADGDTLVVNQVKGLAVPAIGGKDVAGTYGTLHIDANGAYTYTLNPASTAFVALKAGQNATDTFAYRVGDGVANATSSLAITVTGQNDGPTATGEARAISEDPTTAALTGNVLTNDRDPDGGTLLVSGVSYNSVPGSVGAPIATTYGTMQIGANGAYTYTLNNASTAVQSLKAGQVVTDTITYTISDGQGGTASASVVVSITGKNDGPTATATNVSITEDGANPASGSVLTTANDVDGDTLTVNQVKGLATNVGKDVLGTYGTLHLNANGTYTYTLNNALPAIQALTNTSPPLSDAFSYRLTDPSGATVTTNLVVTINGADENSAPVVAAATNFIAAAGAESFALGIGAPTDADGDTLTVTVSGVPIVGQVHLGQSFGGGLVSAGDTLSVAQLQSLTYTPPATGAASSSFSYSVSDGQGHSTPGEVNIAVAAVGAALTGGAAGETLIGSDADNSISTDAGANIVYAHGGDDTITSNFDAAPDVVDGGDGHDTLSMTGAAGTYTISEVTSGPNTVAVIDTASTTGIDVTTSDVDTVSLTLSAASTVTVSGDLGSAGVDKVIVQGSAGVDTFDASGADNVSVELYGQGGNDTLRGGSGADLLDGGAGVNQLFGGAGNDVLVVALAVPGSTFDGGGDFDTLRLTSGFLVNGAYSSPFFLSTVTSIEAVEFASGQTSGVAQAVFNYSQLGAGLAKDATLNGDLQSNQLIIFAAGRSDHTYTLEDTNFTLVNWSSPQDAIYLINNETGSFDFTGSDANDLLITSNLENAGDDGLAGGAGDDILVGGDGVDNYYGDDGDDWIIIGEVDAGRTISGETYDGGAGLDYLRPVGFVELLDADISGVEGIWFAPGPVGAPGDASLTVDVDLLSQLPDDFILRGTGLTPSDVFYDTLTINLGENASIDLSHVVLVDWGAEDFIAINGADGNETIIGSQGNDSINGDATAGPGGGDDVIYGVGGDDVLDGWGGRDELYGGAGDDVLQVFSNEYAAGEVLDGGEDVDTLEVFFVAPGQTVDFQTATIASIEKLQLFSAIEPPASPTFQSATFSVTQATAELASSLEIIGDASATDYVTVIGGSFDASGWQFTNWNDSNLDPRKDDAVILVGTIGSDTADTLIGTSHKDILFGVGGQDALYGNSGNDVLNISANGVTGGSVFDGGDGQDVLVLNGGALDAESGYRTIDMRGSTVSSIEIVNFDVSGGNFPISGDKEIIFNAGQMNTADPGGLILVGSVDDDIVTFDMTTTGAFSASGIFAVPGTWTSGSDLIIVNGTDGADTITGSNYDDEIHAGEGNDIVHGGAGNDVLDGGETGTNQLYGDAGDDTIAIWSDEYTAGQTYDGGADNDTLEINFADSTRMVDLQASTLAGIERIDLVSDFDGPPSPANTQEVVFSVTQATTALASDLLTTGDANAADRVTVIGGSFDASGWQFENWTNAVPGPDRANDDLVILVGTIGSDTADTLIGTSQADVLFGLGGQDVLRGMDGNDNMYIAANGVTDGSVFDGGAGQDILVLNGGAFNADAGHLVIDMTGSTVSSIEIVNFNVAANPFPVLGDKEIIFNSDQMNTAAPFGVILVGSAYSDMVTFDMVTPGSFTAEGIFAAADWTSDQDFIFINGTSGADTITGSSYDDGIFTGDGNDSVHGGTGNDLLDGEGGVDQLYGDAGDDVLVLDHSAAMGAVLDGGADYDTLRLTGGELANGGYTTALYFANLNSIEAIEFASDESTGISSVVLGVGQPGLASNLTIIGDDRVNQVVFGTGPSGTYSLAGYHFSFENWTAGVDQVLLVNGFSGSFHFIGSDTGEIMISGANGSAGNDILEGGGGNDTLVGGAGVDEYYGGVGDDQIIVGELGFVTTVSGETYDGGDGVDYLRPIGDVTLTDGDITGIEGFWFAHPGLQGGPLGATLTIAADLLTQLEPDFAVRGSGVFNSGLTQVDGLIVEMSPGDSVDLSHVVLSDWQFNGPDDDFIDVHGSSADDTILGSDASGDLIGNGGVDTITGGSHEDWLTGGDGADILTGGVGPDAFVYNSATEGGDTVTDFISGVDRIEISAAGFGGGLTEGVAALFISGTDPQASGSGGQFLYHSDTGELYWDQDGDGAAYNPALLATLLGAPELHGSDIFVIS